MSTAYSIFGKRRIIVMLAFSMAGPIFFTQCKSTGGGSFRDVKYDPATLGTPPGHGLQKKEYPFDDNGKYRKDWVQSNAAGRTRTSYPGERTSPGSATTVASVDESTTSEYPNYAELSSAGSVTESSPTATPSGPTATSSSPIAAPSSSTVEYHKVATGDTLFALAARYNVSIADLKRVNGLSSDSIRVGQSLRIP